MGSIIYRGLPLPPELAPETTSQELWLANDMAGSSLEVQMLQWAMLPTAMPLEDMLWDDVNGLGLSWTSAIRCTDGAAAGFPPSISGKRDCGALRARALDH